MTDPPRDEPMNEPTEHRDDLRQRMAECAALDASDPMRRDLLREIVEADQALQQEWIDLIADDERTRLDLIDATPSSSLHRRLQELPDTTPVADAPATAGSIRSRTWTRPLVSMAAAVLIGATIWLALGPLAPDAQAARLDAFGAAAVEHHLMGMPMIIQTADVGQLDERLRGTVDFAYHLPDLTKDGYTLVGARPCHLKGKDIIQSQWKRDGKLYSVYVVCPPDFDLPKTIDRCDIGLTKPASDGSRRTVTVWSGGDCVYAIVPETGETTS